MKLKTLAAMCKRAGIFQLYDVPNSDGEIVEQWLGTPGAMYPLAGLPILSEDNLITMFDLTRKQCEDISFIREPLPAQLCFDDAQPGEVMLDREKITLGYGGRTIRPVITRGGLSFVDNEYFSPLADVIDEVELYERYSPEGGVYFAAKMGLMIVALFAPLQIVEEKLVENLEMLAQKCRDALNIKIVRESATVHFHTRTPEQTKMEDER